MEDSKAREKYRLIRYEYYHSGRTLFLSGCFLSGGILLGYAVETTLKAGLLEVLSEKEKEKQIKNRKGILFQHDINKIFDECVSAGIFREIEVSEDFLEFINNNFQRYPSQQYEIFQKASKRNIVLCNSTDYVYYYDDLIVQLDNYLLKYTSDHSISMVYFAYRTLETRYAQDLLRENAFALKLFQEFEQKVKEHLPSREDLKQQVIRSLGKGFNYYWDEGRDINLAFAKIQQILEHYKASNFKFQKWGEKPYVTI